VDNLAMRRGGGSKIADTTAEKQRSWGPGGGDKVGKR
jgi:hypothetical protein